MSNCLRGYVVVSFMGLLLYLFPHIIHSLFSQEIALLSRFKHDNIVQYYGTERVLYSCPVFSFLLLICPI